MGTSADHVATSNAVGGHLDDTVPPASSYTNALDLADRTDAWESRLKHELRPAGILQEIVVSAIARNVASRELGAAAETAGVQHAAQNAGALQALTGVAPQVAALMAAMASEVVSRAARYRIASERALFGSLRTWQAVSATSEQPLRLSLFAHEDECNEYLANWQKNQPWECPSCGGLQRWLLPSRAKFECRCGQQHSVRAGTLFAGARKPLVAWFDLLTVLLVRPAITATEALEFVNVVRVGTMRRMLKDLRRCLNDPNADVLLAGLPAYIASHLRQVSVAARAPTMPLDGPQLPTMNPNHREIRDRSRDPDLPRRPR